VQTPEEIAWREVRQCFPQGVEKQIEDWFHLPHEDLAQGVVWFDDGTSHQSDEGFGPCTAVAETESRLDKSAQNLPGCRAVAGLPGILSNRFQLVPAETVQRHQAPFEDRLQQRFLAAEVIIDRRHVRLGSAGDGPQGGVVETFGGEKMLGGIENSLFGVGLTHALFFLWAKCRGARMNRTLD